METGYYGKNDPLYFEMLHGGEFRVTEVGEVLTLRDRAGHLKTVWRRCDSLDKRSGYHRIHYAFQKLPAHRLVFLALVGPLHPDLQINHKNGIRHDNRPENLELVTSSENQRHAYRVLGRLPSCGRAKVTERQVEEIRELIAVGLSQKEISARYHLSKSTVSYIANRKTWVRADREASC